MAVTHAIAMRDTICDLVVDAIDAGTDGKLVFRITGSTADSPTTAVATLTFASTAFDDAVAEGLRELGRESLDAIASDTSAAGGDMAFATLETSAAVVCAHCSVGTSGEDINMSSLSVTATDTVSVSALTYTAPV